MSRPRIATCWLDGCSGCHMSILDMDEAIIDVASKADVVYGPYVDIKEFPENVDVTFVEGAVSSEDDLHKIEKIRSRTKILVSLGDCGITGNVPSMRNAFGAEVVLKRAYGGNGSVPLSVVPKLLPNARPIHEIVPVDLFIPGCPPAASTIHYAITELLAGRIPDLSGKTRFGA